MGSDSGVPRRTDGITLVKARPVHIGVIADTHGLFDPAIRRHFAKVDHIIHAGDIGGPAVVEELESLAPVTAVSGNVDRFENSGFPREAIIRRGGVTIGVRHILYERGALTREAKAWLDREQPDLCIFGHSHKPTTARYGRTLLFNPGSAGPRRFSLPRGIGMVTITHHKILPRHLRLSDQINARSREAAKRRTHSPISSRRLPGPR